jgi:predicted ATPase
VIERVRQLDRRTRAVLFCASVIGRRFDLHVLTATAAQPPAEIRTALACACALQLLEREDTGGERFMFRHALTRDIVYGEMLAARTRPLHRRIARALEANADAPIEDVAYHWWAARDRRRGVRTNELAGDLAAAVHASGVALVHYGRALALVDARSESNVRLTEKIRLMEGGSSQ